MLLAHTDNVECAIRVYSWMAMLISYESVLANAVDSVETHQFWRSLGTAAKVMHKQQSLDRVESVHYRNESVPLRNQNIDFI